MTALATVFLERVVKVLYNIETEAVFLAVYMYERPHLGSEITVPHSTGDVALTCINAIIGAKYINKYEVVYRRQGALCMPSQSRNCGEASDACPKRHKGPEGMCVSHGAQEGMRIRHDGIEIRYRDLTTKGRGKRGKREARARERERERERESTRTARETRERERARARVCVCVCVCVCELERERERERRTRTAARTSARRRSTIGLDLRAPRHCTPPQCQQTPAMSLAPRHTTTEQPTFIH